MGLTRKEFLISIVAGVLFSVAIIWTLGFTAAIAFPDWMRELTTENIAPNKWIRVICFYSWEIIVVHFAGAGILLTMLLSGLYWWLGKADYKIFVVIMWVYLVFHYLVLPLWYGYFDKQKLSGAILVQPMLLLIIGYLVTFYFSAKRDSTNTLIEK